MRLSRPIVEREVRLKAHLITIALIAGVSLLMITLSNNGAFGFLPGNPKGKAA